jgi:methylthioribose-1-phosphate isomerase
MKINGVPYHTIWLKDGDETTVQVIDQRLLPHEFVICDLHTAQDACRAICDMTVRGAPLIGVTAAYGLYLAARESTGMDDLLRHAAALRSTRPTAVNLAFAIEAVLDSIRGKSWQEVPAAALRKANEIKAFEIENCRLIGEFGWKIIEQISRRKNGAPVNVLTHCNAGWLACVDYGTATAPIYAAHDRGIGVHVWVDETRPRNQGARLTAFELGQHGVPHTVIVDNAGGHLMQHGMVDVCIVGSDRTTRRGDVANKIGTYLKALAAHDNGIPFFVALPSSSIDWSIVDGLEEIPIEQRDEAEVKTIDGLSDDGVKQVWITPRSSPAANYAFDVTPARLVSGLITEKGICDAVEGDMRALFGR